MTQTFLDTSATSAAMRRLLWDADAFARSDRPLLLLGEPGVGKTFLARYLHDRSRRTGRFVKQNCAALVEGLMVGTFLGHSKGAYTGADASGEGLFVQAHKGTLFLDEVADASHALQTMLMSFLDDGVVRPLGDQRTVSVATRVIAATNADVNALIAERRFRPDLRQRFGPFTLSIPPLRERRCEILTMARDAMRKEYVRVGATRPLEVSADVEEFLHTHQWPGNIRELQLTCEAAVLRMHARSASVLELEDLPPSDTSMESRPRAGGQTLLQQLEHTLKECRGNKAAVARRMGISRQQVYRLLERHGEMRAASA